MPEQDALGIVARDRCVARIDGIDQADGDGGGPPGDAARREHAALVRAPAARFPHTSAGAGADARMRTGAEQGKDGN
jgi:hypothetical protein